MATDSATPVPPAAAAATKSTPGVPAPPPPAPAGEAAIVCLLVDDMAASLAFYVDVLPFAVQYAMDAAAAPVPVGDRGRRGEVVFAMLKSAAGAEVMLQLRAALEADYLPAGAMAAAPAPAGAGAQFSIYVRGVDVDAAYAGLPPTAEVLFKPRTMPYKMREMALRDPANGFVVVLTKSTETA